jgi:hypothetical protein
MNLINWIKEKLFYLRLWIGRIEKCYKCGKVFWHNKESFYYSYLTEFFGGYIETACKSCSKESKNEVIK